MMQSSLIESSLFETHFDIIPFGIYVVDVNTYEIVFMNRFLKERFGDHKGRLCHQALYQTDKPCIFCKIRNLTTGDGKPNGRTYIFEHFNEVDDSWYQLQEKVISWPDGRVVKYSIAVDISELKETQNRLAEAHAQLALKNSELMRQNEVLQENISLREDVERITQHDLKTPLNSIISLPELICLDFDLPQEAKAMLKTISRSGLAMLNMINLSLDMYKLENKTYSFKPSPMDLAALIRRVMGELGNLSRPKRIDVRPTMNGRPLDEDARLVVPGDEMLCYSMLSNLLRNALEAAPRDTTLEVALTGGNPVALAITNQGEVPESIRERFFEKYTTHGKRHGTGLGTYSARLIAQAHGGDVTLDTSTPGRTTVTTTLPGE